MKKYLFNVIQYIKFVNITFRKKLEIPEPNLEKKKHFIYSGIQFIIIYNRTRFKLPVLELERCVQELAAKCNRSIELIK